MEITGWGKSMYGGWYANYIENGNYTGGGFRTINELRAWAKANDLKLENSNRYDN